MKKTIILFFAITFFISTQSFAIGSNPYNENVQVLKQDKDFLNFYNTQFNFIAALSKSKKTEIFQKFVAQSATKSEITELAIAVGYENEVGLNNFLLNQTSLIKNSVLTMLFLKIKMGKKFLVMH